MKNHNDFTLDPEAFGDLPEFVQEVHKVRKSLYVCVCGCASVCVYLIFSDKTVFRYYKYSNLLCR